MSTMTIHPLPGAPHLRRRRAVFAAAVLLLLVGAQPPGAAMNAPQQPTRPSSAVPLLEGRYSARPMLAAAPALPLDTRPFDAD